MKTHDSTDMMYRSFRAAFGSPSDSLVCEYIHLGHAGNFLEKMSATIKAAFALAAPRFPSAVLSLDYLPQSGQRVLLPVEQIEGAKFKDVADALIRSEGSISQHTFAVHVHAGQAYVLRIHGLGERLIQVPPATAAEAKNPHQMEPLALELVVGQLDAVLTPAAPPSAPPTAPPSAHTSAASTSRRERPS